MSNPIVFIPNGLRYLVLPDPVEAKSETFGEITISQQADIHQKASEGTVVSVGDGEYAKPMIVSGLNCDHSKHCKYRVGDKVIYGKYSGYEHNFEGVEYKVLAESEILGVRPALPNFDGPSDFDQIQRSFPL